MVCQEESKMHVNLGSLVSETGVWQGSNLFKAYRPPCLISFLTSLANPSLQSSNKISAQLPVVLCGDTVVIEASTPVSTIILCHKHHKLKITSTTRAIALQKDGNTTLFTCVAAMPC